MTDQPYKPVVSKHIAEQLALEKQECQPVHENKAYAVWKQHYSRKYKYAKRNGWLIEDADGTIHPPVYTHVSLRKKEIDNAVKRTRQTITQSKIPLGQLSFHRFIQRTGLSDQAITDPIDYINTVSTQQQSEIFQKIGFMLVNQTLSESTILDEVDAPKHALVLHVHHLNNQSLYFLIKPIK